MNNVHDMDLTNEPTDKQTSFIFYVFLLTNHFVAYVRSSINNAAHTNINIQIKNHIYIF